MDETERNAKLEALKGVITEKASTLSSAATPTMIMDVIRYVLGLRIYGKYTYQIL
jgi:hypothetical protein